MRQCIRCNNVKFWFQMYSRFMGYYIWESRVCKSCAHGDLTYLAVSDYQDSHETIPSVPASNGKEVAVPKNHPIKEVENESQTN